MAIAIVSKQLERVERNERSLAWPFKSKRGALHPVVRIPKHPSLLCAKDKLDVRFIAVSGMLAHASVKFQDRVPPKTRRPAMGLQRPSFSDLEELGRRNL
jgi:hypothetical protein